MNGLNIPDLNIFLNERGSFMDSYKCTIADLAYYENEKQIDVNVEINDDDSALPVIVPMIFLKLTGGAGSLL